MVKIDDIINKKFGKLTVISFDHKEPYSYSNGNKKGYTYYYKCLCECGNECVRRRDSLIYKHSESCGCSIKENFKPRQSKLNEYNLEGEYGIGYCNRQTFFLFDKEDYDIIKNIHWFIDTNTNYVLARFEGKNISLHRFIMRAKEGEFVDHINRVRTDCRKSNLRFCTQQQNNINRTITNKNNSGVVGVYFNKFTNRWRAYITFNKKQKSRNFKTKQEAIDCRRKWEKELFGDFNPINNNEEDS